MGRVRVTRKLDRVVLLELQCLLEPLSNLGKRFFALFERAALALLAGERLAHRPRPEADAVEAASDVDNDAHDLVVVFVLQVFANGGKHDVQPESVNVDSFLILELESPFAAVLVLRVFPLWAYALLEEMIVRLEREIRCGCNVVLPIG